MADKKQKETVLSSGVGKFKESKRLRKEKLQKRLAPDAMNPNSMDHFYIKDMGVSIYARSFYVEKLPMTVTFAKTFRELFNTRKVVSSVFIKPMSSTEAQKLMQNKMRRDETELIEAQQAGNSYEIQKISVRVNENNEHAQKLSSGMTKWYDLAFLFTITRESLDLLDIATKEFIDVAKSKSIEISSCYGMQAEAYLTNGPYNRVYPGKMALFKSIPVKWHIFDQEAVGAIFNHTNTYFSHPDGIPIGHNLFTLEPVLWTPYAKGHDGFSCAFVGKTGTGKSATIKMFASRFTHFGYRFAAVDTDVSGGRGEYSRLCEEFGGVVFELRSNSSNKLNIFELDAQIQKDDATGVEYRTLSVTDKCSTARNIIMSAIISGKTQPSFELQTSMESILGRCITDIYADKGIYDGVPDSLFTQGGSSGRVKKPLPTMSDAYLWILKAQAENTIEEHILAYRMLSDALVDMVNNLYYDADTYERCTAEDYRLRQMTKRNIRHVNGTRGYFDGQSTISITRETPFIDIDISGLPDTDKVLGQQVALNFLTENFIKKNSQDVAHAQKICMIKDEAHRMFPNPLSRKFMEDQVRTARKNNASLWICTQNHKDFTAYPETEVIISQVASLFMLKQDASDREYLKEKTILTPSAVDRVISIGGDPSDPTQGDQHKGELCLIDSNNVVFVKVDYLTESEFLFVETDVAKRQKYMEAHGMSVAT